MSIWKARDGRNFFRTFLLVTFIFFLWGFALSLSDLLNKHFQDTFGMTRTYSAFVQCAVLGTYFFVAFPAGRFISRFGYRAGFLAGLTLTALGGLLFLPAGTLMEFWFFLLALAVVSSGLCFLEITASPYLILLGEVKDAPRRMTLAHSCNALGWMIGPLLGTTFIFNRDGTPSDVSTPYLVLGIVALLAAAAFALARMDYVKPAAEEHFDLIGSNHVPMGEEVPLFRHRNFIFALVALGLYVGAQTGVNAFFINYAVETAYFHKSFAATLLGIGGAGMFMLGRLVGTLLMRRISAEVLLVGGGIISMLCVLTAILMPGLEGSWALYGVYFFESTMFPTIFALALRGVGRHVNTASSLLVMTFVGGAIAPLTMGAIADRTGSIASAFIVVLACFFGVTVYGLYALVRAARRD